MRSFFQKRVLIVFHLDTESPAAMRVRASFPDGSASPFLCVVTPLIAGLDEIKDQSPPGEVRV